MIRQPVAAGKFYPDDPETLKKTIRVKSIEVEEKYKAKGVVSPHAGYFYSGDIAARVYSYIDIPETVFILGPNHNGLGGFYSLSGADYWETPLGKVPVNKELTEKIIKYSPFIQVDDTSHMYEHSIEVQLPFLQYYREDLNIVPISLMGYELREIMILAKGIINAINEFNKEVLIVASTDFSHYVPADEAKKLDFIAIEQILSINPEELWKKVKDKRISMCGVAPTTMMLEIVKEQARNAKLLKYATSGDVSGDSNSVVGYAGIVVY
jgi:AmmeMemoRadiSam system protein B